MPQTVNVWTKFLELRCIIDSSLQNIEDRWKEGQVRKHVTEGEEGCMRVFCSIGGEKLGVWAWVLG